MMWPTLEGMVRRFVVNWLMSMLVDRAGADEGFVTHRTEADTLKCERYVGRNGCLGNVDDQAEDVDGPEVVVAQGVPEAARGDGLPIVHVPW